MNEIAKTAEAPVYGLVPTSMTEAMKLAEMMASARLVPQGLQKSPADCLMVIQQAVRWQMDPFAVAQECSVIQGKLMHTGKLVAAVVNARGNLTQRLSFDYRGEGDNRTIVVSGQLQGEPAPRTVEVILKNARTQNKVWQTQPDQQLMYHGVRVWARRHTPELMLGVYSPEEFDEPVPARSPKTAPVAAKNVMLPAHDAETGEIVEESTASSSAEEAAAPVHYRASAGAADLDADDLMVWDDRLKMAADNMGVEGLKQEWSMVPKPLRPKLKSAKDKYKTTAMLADSGEEGT